MKYAQVIKDENNELPIPIIWRPTFVSIVGSFTRSDFSLTEEIDNVTPISNKSACQIEEYINDYGEKLVPLPEQTWESSIYIWNGDHWQALIDLWTEAEGRSDLVLSAKITEANEKHLITIDMVYVP